MRRALIAVLFVSAFAIAGCGGSGRPLPVKYGMAAKDVRAVAGRPFHIGPLLPEWGYGPCWYYNRTKTGKPVAVAVCFTNGRVAKIDWSYTV